LLTLDLTIPPRTTASRSVFINSSARNPNVTVTVAQITGVNGGLINGGLQSTVATNPDITNPDITNPDITNPDITNPDITNPYSTNPDITNAEVYDPTVTNPDITNPDITNPDITNPDITNPEITNPDITNVASTNPDITNPDITNPDITNPDITNPDITNPDITNISDGATDFTYKVANRGNTSSSYNAKEFAKQLGVMCCPAGCAAGGGGTDGHGNACPAQCNKCQLIARKTYGSPAAIPNSCQLGVQLQNIPISSIPNPAFTDAGTVGSPDNSSDPSNSTLSLGPGEGARFTLRVFGMTTTQLPNNSIKTVAVAGAADTGQNTPAASLTIITTELPVAVVGTNYNTTLMSVGGIGATSWFSTAGAFPQQLMLTSATGNITGLVTDTPSAYPLTFKV